MKVKGIGAIVPLHYEQKHGWHLMTLAGLWLVLFLGRIREGRGGWGAKGSVAWLGSIDSNIKYAACQICCAGQ